MKDLIKAGFNKGLVIGAAIATANAVLTIVSIPRTTLRVLIERSEKNKAPKVEEE